MFGRRHRRSNPILLLFRTILSLVMFLVLIVGLYSAYKHFSGLDPLKINPGNVLGVIMSSIGKLDVRNLKMDKEIGGLKLDNLTSNIQPRAAGIASGDARQNPPSNLQHPASSIQTPSSRSLSFKFALIADSHNDNVYLKKALTQIKKDYPAVKFIIGLGDYTEVGTVDELRAVKKEFDVLGTRYFLIPGDHDLWDSRDKGRSPIANFKQVFGPAYQSFSEDNMNFILINNSDNYAGVDDEQMSWISDQLEKMKNGVGIYIFVHEPLYHPSSDHMMGKTEVSLKSQAQNLIKMFAQAGVKKILAGDIHYFSEYTEPETGMPMVTIGAITSERNTQAPRFGIGKVYDNGEIEVEDIEIR